MKKGVCEITCMKDERGNRGKRVTKAGRVVDMVDVGGWSSSLFGHRGRTTVACCASRALPGLYRAIFSTGRPTTNQQLHLPFPSDPPPGNVLC
mmetsp:Transcript_2500/g.5449  ORF Transcript_2500/g.5449 Transcript_2500/m.5449 type:complete len:93 (-) Transcript_2500:29-307(-)